MEKEELIKRLEEQDKVASKVDAQCFTGTGSRYVTPVSVMFRMRDLIRCQKAEIETLREQLKKDEAALQGNIEIFCDLKNENSELRCIAKKLADCNETALGWHYPEGTDKGRIAAENARHAYEDFISANIRDHRSPAQGGQHGE